MVENPLAVSLSNHQRILKTSPPACSGQGFGEMADGVGQFSDVSKCPILFHFVPLDLLGAT